MAKDRLLNVAGPIFLFLLVLSGSALASGGCGADCKQCHTVNKAEVSRIVSSLNPAKKEITITGISASDVRGLWKVSFDNAGQKGYFYMDYAMKHLIAGIVIPVNSVAHSSVNNAAAISTREASIVGNPRAGKKIVIFFDPDCHFCAREHKAVKDLVAKRKDVAVYYEVYPLLHRDAYLKDKAAYCEKSIGVLKNAFGGLVAAKCDPAAVDKTIRSVELHAVPTLILPGNKMVTGYLPEKELESYVN